LLVLKTLDAQGAMHGYAITSHIQRVSAELLRVEEGSLYPALHRMAQDGWLRSEWGTTDKNREAMFYTITYVFTSLASFGIIMLLSRAGFECEQLDDFKGLNQRSPWFAFIMLLVMFSLAGLPPTVGFYAKFSVIEAAVNAGFVWLAVAAVVASLVGAFYYLRVVKLMYFDDAVDRSPLDTRGDARVLLSTNGVLLLLLGILPQPLMGLCVIALTQSRFL